MIHIIYIKTNHQQKFAHHLVHSDRQIILNLHRLTSRKLQQHHVQYQIYLIQNKRPMYQSICNEYPYFKNCQLISDLAQFINI